MAKPSPPKFDGLPKLSTSEVELHIIRCWYRNKANIEAMKKGELNSAFVALEALHAIGPILLDGETPTDIIEKAFPVASWREDTVTIPADFLRILVTAWGAYEQNVVGKSFGQCLGIEFTNRQGKSPMLVRQKKNDQMRKLANEVFSIYADLGDRKLSSLEAAMSTVAEKHGVSTETVKRAFSKYRAQIEAHILAETETSNRLGSKPL
jgi:hypothetical protein